MQRVPDFKYGMLKVKEFSLMADNQYRSAENDFLIALAMFPNLRKLSLAHMLLVEGRWGSLLSKLWQWKLEQLWLINPRHISLDVASGKYLTEKYEGGEGMAAAAEQVRLIDTESLWTAVDEPPRMRDFEYPGFALFERV